MRKNLFLCMFLLLGLAAAQAAETRVVVRARAKAAKFIGTSMGGALVVIRDSDTGQVLARGVTLGGTGDTKRLMSGTAAGQPISDENSAGFEAVLDISEPTLVNIEVSAPLAQRQSLVSSSTQVWLIPGKNITGDGIVLEIPGFAVDVISPQAHETLDAAGGKTLVKVEANIVMM
jgi:hypothetical protein